DGLHRYDGYEFKVYSYTPFDSTSISSSILYHIEESSDGKIWVTVEARGIQRLDTDTGKFTNYLHDPKNPASLSSDRTFDIKEGKNGDMWVSTTDAGLNHMPAGADGEFRHYRHKA